jgi:small subunit ribosomal protein S8
MSMTDPLGDILTRIRNAQQARLSFVTAPVSNLILSVLEVLKREGYIRDFTSEQVRQGVSEVKIELRYHEGVPAIKEIKRSSKPGRRVYSSISKLKTFYNGLGIAILSTPKGVMSDHEARNANVGGEILCYVF